MLIACFCTIPFSTSANAPSNKVRISLYGQPLSITPKIVRGTVTVPLAALTRALGAQAAYDKQAITITQGKENARLTIGAPSYTAFDGRTATMAVAPSLQQGTTYVPLRAITEMFGLVVTWDAYTQTIHIKKPLQLPTIKNEQQLAEMIENSRLHAATSMRTPRVGITMEKSEAPAAPAASASDGAFTPTNVQVAGVDEADWAKTNGTILAQLSGARVIVSDVTNASAPSLITTLDFSNESFVPLDLYVDEKRLVVIGQASDPIMMRGPLPMSDRTPNAKIAAIMPQPPTKETVKTYVYAISAGKNLTRVRETEQEGTYVTSRKIQDVLYTITNKYAYVSLPRIWCDDCERAPNDTPIASSYEPSYSDQVLGERPITIPLPKIEFFPKSMDTNVLLIGALDMNTSDPIEVRAYFGSGQTVYASQKHVYVATAVTEAASSAKAPETHTHVHKFRLDGTRIVYIGQTTVPGTVINQFAIDEYEGYLRIATTVGDPWSTSSSTNHLFVIDESLRTIGKIDGLAPGERIYSVRFMGTRAYMVTFRTVDPLFVLDIHEPNNPRVLGVLKIPGYSDYLHPYDDQHLIGFGKDTTESKAPGTDTPIAYYQGIKMALFDVTDVRRPIQKFSTIIGDRGTHSELLQNHKALLFSKKDNLLSFPVNLYEIPDKKGTKNTEIPEYGQFVYQGAYVYHIDTQKGFELRGRITHMTDEDILKSGDRGFDPMVSVRRIMRIQDTLYTLSERMIKVNKLIDLTDVASISIPSSPPNPITPATSDDTPTIKIQKN
jgi:uncharacterized secreted protein with C-terminal beta-propeller domain